MREVHHELRARREGVGRLIEVYKMRSASARKDRETWQRARRSEWDNRGEVQINEQISGGRIKGAI